VDPSHSLIDAVIAWENLVGTSTEVTFRVSASLAKLCEEDPTKRLALQKELSKIYGIRSRLVHGALVAPDVLSKASASAIGTAVRALRASYARGREWLALKSEERSNSILLE
jgi:hypothetical protein